MEHVTSASGATVSFDKYGSGPPLVLVHGGFSDHRSNWMFVKPMFEPRFTVYAVARRGRGETDATLDHDLRDEGMDVAAVIESIGEPVFLLGHSYGGQVSLAAAAAIPHRIRKLVLYEPPSPRTFTPELFDQLKTLGQSEQWSDMAMVFFRDGLRVPVEELREVKASDDLWPPIVTDARATFGDLQALIRYDFNPAGFVDLTMPVMLQVGTESPRELYVTDSLAPVLQDVRIDELPNQAHEGMTTAPELYARAVISFLLES
jgi:pimeloyl-ACP methyl ester carboxylesterase